MSKEILPEGFVRCKGCQQVLAKTTDNFFRNKSRVGGLRLTCKRCRKEYNNRPDQKFRENKLFASYSRKRRQDPEERKKIRCRQLVSQKIRKGRWLKPSICEKCQHGGKIEAHHYLGYAFENRYDVQWLCRKCHDESAVNSGAHISLACNSESTLIPNDV